MGSSTSSTSVFVLNKATALSGPLFHIIYEIKEVTIDNLQLVNSKIAKSHFVIHYSVASPHTSLYLCSCYLL